MVEQSARQHPDLVTAEELSELAAEHGAAKLPTQIGHALLAEDFSGAAELISRLLAEQADVPFSIQLRWFMALPQAALAEHSSLLSHAALVAAYEQRFDLSQRWLEAGADAGTEPVETLGAVALQLVLAGDLRTLLGISQRLKNLVTESSTLWSLAHGSVVGARFATGDVEGALAAIVATLRPVASTPESLLDVQAAARPVAARLLLELGRPEQARAALAEMRAWLTDAPAACSTLAPVLWAEAMVALEEGDLRAAADWETAPEQASALGLPFFEVWMLLDFASVRAAVGDEPGARHALFRAQALVGSFREPGTFEARLNEVGAPFGVSALARAAQHPVSVPGVDLSARELDVLALLDSDLQLRQIAERLFITQNTLKAHVRSIYRKLGVSSRLSAVRATAK